MNAPVFLPAGRAQAPVDNDADAEKLPDEVLFGGDELLVGSGEECASDSSSGVLVKMQPPLKIAVAEPIDEGREGQDARGVAAEANDEVQDKIAMAQCPSSNSNKSSSSSNSSKSSQSSSSSSSSSSDDDSSDTGKSSSSIGTSDSSLAKKKQRKSAKLQERKNMTRSFMFGPYRLTPRFGKGDEAEEAGIIGYQITCHRPNHPPHCTRSVLNTVSGSSEASIRTLKAWALLGEKAANKVAHKRLWRQVAKAKQSKTLPDDAKLQRALDRYGKRQRDNRGAEAAVAPDEAQLERPAKQPRQAQAKDIDRHSQLGSESTPKRIPQRQQQDSQLGSQDVSKASSASTVRPHAASTKKQDKHSQLGSQRSVQTPASSSSASYLEPPPQRPGQSAPETPPEVVARMTTLIRDGLIQQTTKEQRRRNKLTPGSAYGVPIELREALHHRYLHPNLPPPRGMQWKAGSGQRMMLVPRGG